MRAHIIGLGLVVALGIAGIAAQIIGRPSVHRPDSGRGATRQVQEATPVAAANAQPIRPTVQELALVATAPQPAHYAPREVEILSREGEAIRIVARRPMIPNPPYMPTEYFLDQYEALVSRAQAGDSAAARMIFRALRTCERRRQDTPKTAAAVARSSESAARYCEGVNDEHFLDAARWAKLASDGGDPLGRQDWAFELQKLGRGEESVEQLEAIWQDGYVGVLQALAIAHKNGLASDGAPDHTRSYTYFYLRYKLAEAGGWDTPSQQARLGAMEEARQGLSGFLTPQQQQFAEAEAMRLLRENSACCIGTL